MRTCVVYLLLAVVLAGCGGSARTVKNFDTFESAESDEQSQINKQIENSALQLKASSFETVYKLGPGDILELTVFQVEELNTKIRVNGRSEIILPLLGKIDVKGKSITEVEDDVAFRLEKDFLQDPQVSLFVEEYRSQQITVMGAVQQPDVYSVRQTRSIFEMLSLAGGLAPEASDRIRVKTTQINAETGESEPQNLILSVKRLLAGSEAASYIRLSGGDSILVPEAGVVFVEGAVNKPGSFSMEGKTSVLKAIALAGGVPWTGSEGNVQVIRDIAGKAFAIDVNLDEIRNQKSEDVVLNDGDIVVVSYSGTKRLISGFFRTAGQIFGYSLK
jgi:polysaccharide export outer membrane protein